MSILFEFDLESNFQDQIKSLFPFQFKELGCGFKYMGFWLKLNNYQNEYWYHLLRKIE